MASSPSSLSDGLLDAAVELLGRHGRDGTVRVRGVSMRPTLVEGQVLQVEFSPGELKRGDLIVFRQGKHLIVHRLLGRKRLPGGVRALRMGGDGYVSLDAPVAPEDVVGRIVAVRDAGGRWLDLRGRGGLWYGRCVARHDLFWAMVGLAALRLEGGLRRLRLAPPIRAWVEGLDRRLLATTHALLFRRLHPPTAGPIDAKGPDGQG